MESQLLSVVQESSGIPPLPFTVTAGKLPELLFDARATSLFGALAALASANEAAASAMAPFMVRVMVV